MPSMQGEKLDSLDLPLMVDRNTDENQTALRYQLMLDLKIMLLLEFPLKTGKDNSSCYKSKYKT